MFIKTIPKEDGEHRILGIATQNQFNIQDSLIQDTPRLLFRMLVEDPIINPGPAMHLSEQDILYLSNATNPELSQWAKEHQLMITKVDYTTTKIFRTDPYTLFMCDVQQEHKDRIEREMSQVLPFNAEEIQQYTTGFWWEAINANGQYEQLCYRALRTLKDNLSFPLDDLAKILNYCGYMLEVAIHNPDKSEQEQPTLVFGNGFQQIFYTLLTSSHLQEFLPPDMLSALEKSLPQFLQELPIEDQMLIFIPKEQSDAYHFISPLSTLNQVFHHLVGNNIMLARPAGGMSHRNRFASALDRVSGTFLPGINRPESIHEVPCSSWTMETYHDYEHQYMECCNFSREAWIHLAGYILEHTKHEGVYNALLDRVVKNQGFDLYSSWESIISSEIAQSDLVTYENLQHHFTRWLQEYAPIFTTLPTSYNSITEPQLQ